MKRTREIKIRLSEKEWQTWTAKARDAQMTTAEFVRTRLRGAGRPGKPGRKPVAEPVVVCEHDIPHSEPCELCDIEAKAEMEAESKARMEEYERRCEEQTAEYERQRAAEKAEYERRCEAQLAKLNVSVLPRIGRPSKRKNAGSMPWLNAVASRRLTPGMARFSPEWPKRGLT